MNTGQTRILFVEDDEVDRMALERFIKEETMPYSYVMATSLSQARAFLQNQGFDIVIADYLLGDGTALELLEMNYNIPIIILTKSGSEEVAVRAMKLGAYDYIIKDMAHDYLKVMPLAVEKALHRKQVEHKINMLSHAISQISDCVFISDANGRIVYLNDAFVRMYGYQEKDVLGHQMDFFWVKDVKEIRKQGPQLISPVHDLYHRRKDGSCFPVSVSHSRLMEATGKSFMNIYVVRDITAQLISEEQHLMALFSEWNPAPVLRVDADSRVLMANRQAHTMFKSRSLQGAEVQGLIPALGLINLTDWIRNDKLKMFHSIRIGRKTFDFAVQGISELSVAHIYGFDATEQNRLYRQLIKKERLASIGFTVASLAHCMKNFFTMLKGGSALLKQAIVEDNKRLTEKSYGLIAKGTNRMYLVLMNMLDYTRKTKGKKEEVSLRELFHEAVESLSVLLSERTITLKSHVEETAEQASLDPQFMHRILLNLGFNAIDAMPEAGELTFSASRKRIEDWALEFPAFHLKKKKDSLLIIEVSDTGRGIPREQIPKIFKPFYSTKGSRGTGLGLSTVKELVEDQGGEIFLRSEPEKGTSFYLVF